MTWIDLVNEYFDGQLSEEECDNILWNRTAFPFGSADYIKNQIQEWKDYLSKYPDKRPCDTCNNPAQQGKAVCASCERALKIAKANE